MRSGFIFGVVALVIGCGTSDKPPEPAPAPPVVVVKAPLRLDIADCTTPVAAPPPADVEDKHLEGALLDDAHQASIKTQGNLDKEQIRRAIRRELPKLQHCYEQQLAKVATLRGTVNETFVIGPAGTVTSSSASGLDPVVAACVDSVVKTIVFPKPGGGSVKVTYPFDFIWTGGDSGEEHAAAAMPTAPVEHVPGASSPLASVRGALEACVRRAELASGSVVLALAFGETNDATITVEGASSPAFATCLAAIKITRPPGAAATARCGFSFSSPAP